MNNWEDVKSKITSALTIGFERLAKISTQEKFVVFLGLEGCGKSTAIQYLFNLDVPFESSLEPMFDSFSIKDGRHPNITGLECPGLKSFILQEENDAILESIKGRLTAHNKVPDYVFIVADLSDYRFQGIYSECNQALEQFKELESHLTDSDWDNMSMILTHGDIPNLQKTIDSRVDMFRAEYKSVFAKEPEYMVINKGHMRSENFPIFEFDMAYLQLHVRKLPLQDPIDEAEKMLVSGTRMPENFVKPSGSMENQLEPLVMSCGDEDPGEIDKESTENLKQKSQNITVEEIRAGPELYYVWGKFTNEIEFPCEIMHSGVPITTLENTEIDSFEFIDETFV